MRTSPNYTTISKTARRSPSLAAQSAERTLGFVCSSALPWLSQSPSGFKPQEVLEYCDGGDLDDKLKERGLVGMVLAWPR